MRRLAFIGFCLLVVAAFVVVPRWVRPFHVGMTEQRVTALLTSQPWFLLKASYMLDDQRCICLVHRKFFVAEQHIWMRFQPGGAITNVTTQWKWRL